MDGCTADLETRRFLKHLGMVRQGGVRLGFQLLEQLVFVFWSHTPGTTRGTADTAQGAEVMLDQIQLHRLKMNLELSRDLSARSARQDSLDDSFPQIQTVSPTPDSAVRALIMQNALAVLRGYSGTTE